MTDDSLAAEGVVPALSSTNLSDIVGQVQAVRRLKPLVTFSIDRGNPLPHILLIGPDGTGKTLLATIMANEMSANIVTTTGSLLENGADLMGILTNMAERDILFIDEIDRLPRVPEELLCPAMETFSVDFWMDKGQNGARLIRIPLHPFTLIGAAHKEADVSRRLRSQFMMTIVLEPYSEVELSAIAQAFARAKGFSLGPGVAALIGQASGAMRTVKSIIRLAARPGVVDITEADVSQAMAILGQHAASPLNGAGGDLMRLSGVDFEVRVTALLKRMGFHTELTRTTGDGGIDIVAVLDRPIVGGRYLVQCKRFAGGIPVSAAMVRDFYGGFVADRHAVKGLFITTSSFTAQAREFAQSLPIELISGDQLSALMQQYMTSSPASRG